MDAGGLGLVAACETGRRVNSPCVREFIAMPRVVQTDPRRPASRLRCPLASRAGHASRYIDRAGPHRVVARLYFHRVANHSHAYVCTYFEIFRRLRAQQPTSNMCSFATSHCRTCPVLRTLNRQRHATPHHSDAAHPRQPAPGHHLERRGFCDIHFGRNSNGSPSYGPCATLARAKMVCNSPFFHLRHASTAPPWKVPSTKN